LNFCLKDPVKFKLEVNKLGENEYEAILVGKLENGWHIYSKDIPEDSGIPTEMRLLGKNIEPIGKVTEVGKKIDEFSEAFGFQWCSQVSLRLHYSILLLLWDLQLESQE